MPISLSQKVFLLIACSVATFFSFLNASSSEGAEGYVAFLFLGILTLFILFDAVLHWILHDSGKK